MLLYNTGARVSEVAQLKVGQLDLASPARVRLLGKGVDFHPEVTRVFHRELTRLKVMFCGLCLGQDMRSLLFRFGYC
jgi:integrase